MSDSREMPKYQSHKQVWALKIKEIVTIAAIAVYAMLAAGCLSNY